MLIKDEIQTQKILNTLRHSVYSIISEVNRSNFVVVKTVNNLLNSFSFAAKMTVKSAARSRNNANPSLYTLCT